MRFIAAVLVVLYHCSQRSFVLPSNLGSHFFFPQGVTFFFILSGFVLAYVYPELTTGEARGRFLLTRFARIWPTHVAVLVLMLVVTPFRIPRQYTLGLGLLNLTMVHAWIPIQGVISSFSLTSWSISTEFAFYLLFPLLIWKWERMWPIKLGVILALTYGLIMYCNEYSVPPAALRRVSMLGLLFFGPLGRLAEFAVGMAAAVLWRKTVTRWQLSAFVATYVQLVAFTLIGLNLYYSTTVLKGIHLNPWIGRAGKIWLEAGGNFAGLSLAFGLFALALEQGFFSRMLALRGSTSKVLADIAFPIYLLHPTLLTYWDRHQTAFSELPAWLLFISYWVILVAASIVIWGAVDRPLRRFIVNLWPDPARAPAERPASRAQPLSWRSLLAPGRRLVLGATLSLVVLLPLTVLFVHAKEGASAAQQQPMPMDQETLPD
jgi:peptidoglycan/LPS O-acetylase OafA/YrhL